jgi:hypothetical protein
MALTLRVFDLCPCTSVQLDLFGAEPRGAAAGSHSPEPPPAWQVIASVQERFGSRAVMLGTQIEVPRREQLLAIL